MLSDSYGSSCATRYPFLMIHGIGFRDDSPFYNYWGRIPRALEARGAQIFYGGQDAWGTIESNAAAITETLRRLIAEKGIDKVNIIAHSKGGLEARYLISEPGLAEHVASLTTVSTPHHGMKSVDFICGFPSPLLRAVGFFVNLHFRVLGDSQPDFFDALAELKTGTCADFNLKHPDSPGILYQSYSARLKNVFSDIIFFFTFPAIYHFDGPNDGMVSTASARWGRHLGTIESAGKRGVSHSDVVDIRRMNFSGLDIREIYVKTAEELKRQGL